LGIDVVGLRAQQWTNVGSGRYRIFAASVQGPGPSCAVFRSDNGMPAEPEYRPSGTGQPRWQKDIGSRISCWPILADGANHVTRGTTPWVGHSGFRAGRRTPDSRERMLATLETIEAIATRENANPIRHRLLELRQRVEQDRFQLAVVGQFKRGKTSVLNALLRGEVLPSGALPFTSVLT
jgi:hypothetical protein